MSSIRSNILTSIQTILTTITTFRTVEINRATAIELGDVALPAAFIYSGDDKPNEKDNIIGWECYDWTVTIECVVTEDIDTEDLLMEIHKKMFANYQFDGNAMSSKRVTSSTLVVATEGLKMLYIEYLITVRHKQGLPDTKDN